MSRVDFYCPRGLALRHSSPLASRNLCGASANLIVDTCLATNDPRISLRTRTGSCLSRIRSLISLALSWGLASEAVGYAPKPMSRRLDPTPVRKIHDFALREVKVQAKDTAHGVQLGFLQALY